LEKLICKIYEDNALGKLPDARYAVLDEQYAKEQDVFSKEIEEIETALGKQEQSRKSADKAEERKDRLHQNYLKRKESGKQKEYEDIAKGVFVPVNTLPKAEMKKAKRSA